MDQLLDTLAIRVDGPRCWHEHIVLDLDLTDTGIRYRLVLRNGVPTYTTAEQATPADAVVHLPTAALPALAGGAAPATGLTVDGDATAIGRLLAFLDTPDPDFAIVSPDLTIPVTPRGPERRPARPVPQ